MHKLSISHRKDTLRARLLHRDAEHAMDLILSIRRALPATVLDEVIQTHFDEEAEDEEGGEVERNEIQEYDVK